MGKGTLRGAFDSCSWYTEPQDTRTPAPTPVLPRPHPARWDRAPRTACTSLRPGNGVLTPLQCWEELPGGCPLLPSHPTRRWVTRRCHRLERVVPCHQQPPDPALAPFPSPHPPGCWSLPQKSPLASACMVTPRRRPRRRPRRPVPAWVHRLPGGERGRNQGSLPAHRSADSRQTAEPGSSRLLPPHRHRPRSWAVPGPVAPSSRVALKGPVPSVPWEGTAGAATVTGAAAQPCAGHVREGQACTGAPLPPVSPCRTPPQPPSNTRGPPAPPARPPPCP